MKQGLTKKIKQALKDQVSAIKKLERDDLDLANAGQWPESIKLLSLLALLASVVFASHWLLINNYQEELAHAREEQQGLLEDYRRRSFQAANLTAYQQQIHFMEEVLTRLLRFLPTENEVPYLLDEIQALANQQQLELLSLSLKKTEQKNFYSQLPFEITVKGSYHHLANFMAGISSLNRIVTLHEFNLTPSSTTTNHLTLVIEAQTYRYDKQGEN